MRNSNAELEIGMARDLYLVSNGRSMCLQLLIFYTSMERQLRVRHNDGDCVSLCRVQMSSMDGWVYE